MDFETEEVFIDLQGFKYELNKFILKEICILSKKSVYHFIVKSPFEWKFLAKNYKRQVNWLKRNYHGIDWHDGHICFSKLKEKIKHIFGSEQNKFIFFVKGEEKVNWFRYLFDIQNNIINIENMGCAISFRNHKIKNKHNEKDGMIHCNLHEHDFSFHCACRNVFLLKEWHETNIKKQVKKENATKNEADEI